MYLDINKDAKLYTQNIAKVKELLAEAGYPNGFKARMYGQMTKV